MNRIWNLVASITIQQVAFVLSILGLGILIADFGLDQTIRWQRLINVYYFLVLLTGVIATISRYLDIGKMRSNQVLYFDVLSFAYICVVVFVHFLFPPGKSSQLSFLYNDNWVKFAIFLTFIREFAAKNINFKRTVLNPAQLFIASFMFLILCGAFLLMLPNATHEGLGFIDALFTSTSAVCVTGLIVVDTGTYFTYFGQVIILILIQLGGLGILTFASYFSYFFKGGSTYENQLVLSDMTNSNKLGEVFRTIKRIIIITFAIELAGALFILHSLGYSDTNMTSWGERIYFSIFHSISAFCNAGFSTLYYGLYDEVFRFNYYMQLVIALTLIFGGLGFPIHINILSFIKRRFITIIRKQKNAYKPWEINITSRITLLMVAFLLSIGVVLFFILEYNNTLAEHKTLWGKLVVSFFNSATPRTAGFNNIDMAAMTFPTVMITIFLMWIGASPASTGGGIKTSTFAVAIMNIMSVAKGKSRIEIYRREIADISVRRASATINLSLLVIGIGVFLISIFDPEEGLLNIAFESFSAYSTVGLSLGITAKLTQASKLVLVCLMFIGRVSMLSILIAIVRKVKFINYRYPTEEILIN